MAKRNLYAYRLACATRRTLCIVVKIAATQWVRILLVDHYTAVLHIIIIISSCPRDLDKIASLNSRIFQIACCIFFQSFVSFL